MRGTLAVKGLTFSAIVRTNPLHANVPFLSPLKILENQRISDIFGGCRDETPGYKTGQAKNYVHLFSTPLSNIAKMFRKSE